MTPSLRVDWRTSIAHAGRTAQWFPVALALPFLLALLTGEDAVPFFVTGVLSLAIGRGLEMAGERGSLGNREAILMVVLVWAGASVLGALPYVLASAGTVAAPVNALFESTSGFTTTGATVMADVSMRTHSRAILLWRQETQWLGGMGIVVLAVAIFPEFAVGGMRLVGAEAPGPRTQKLTPRIAETARALWKLYVGITLAEVGLLYLLHLAGLAPRMSLYMAVAHGFSTMATGGFSPAAQSIAGFSAAVQWAVVPFMVGAGINFALFHRVREEGLAPVRADPEFRFYVGVLAAVSALVFGLVFVQSPDLGAVRHAVFQAVSIVTTTGFASVDFATWSTPAQYLLVAAMLLGGSAGSTASAVKMVRWLVVSKSIRRALFTTVHPTAVRSVRLGDELLDERTVRGVHAFTLLYLLLFLVGSLVVLANGTVTGHALTGLEALSATAASLGNVGPGVGAVGPMDNYLLFPPTTRLLLAGLMLLGRLEILTVVTLATGAFWRG